MLPVLLLTRTSLLLLGHLKPGLIPLLEKGKGVVVSSTLKTLVGSILHHEVAIRATGHTDDTAKLAHFHLARFEEGADLTTYHVAGLGGDGCAELDLVVVDAWRWWGFALGAACWAVCSLW